MKNKKVGVMSLYYKNYNYGGQLQVYALSHKITQLGYSCKHISFQRGKQFWGRKIVLFIMYPMKRKKQLLSIYMNRIKTKFNMGADSSRKNLRKFDSFIKNIPHSEVYTPYNIAESAEKYDIFVVGSDQVWNTDLCSDEWFFNFLTDNKYRVSYSASIAKKFYTEKEKKRLKPLLSKFSHISVREQDGKLLLENFINKNIDVVLDPTMLLTESEWKKLSGKNRVNGKYIVLYLLGNDKNIKLVVNQYADMMGLKVVFISDPKYVPTKTDAQYWNPFDDGIGPKEFVNLIENAEYVFTDSFHATVLSIIFHKKFFVFNINKATDKRSMNSRIDTILTTFHLESRRIRSDKIISKSELESDIEYTKVEDILSRQREVSTRYLERILSDYNNVSEGR